MPKNSTYQRKFGTDFPTMETLCKVCGQCYGDHSGPDCPNQFLVDFTCPKCGYEHKCAIKELIK